jgi:hypothetical protein
MTTKARAPACSVHQPRMGAKEGLTTGLHRGTWHSQSELSDDRESRARGSVSRRNGRKWSLIAYWPAYPHVPPGVDLRKVRGQVVEPLPVPHSGASRRFSFRRPWVWFAAAAVLVAVGLIAVRSRWASPDAASARAVPLTSLQGVVRSPSLSPDGTYVVFSQIRTKAEIETRIEHAEQLIVESLGRRQRRGLLVCARLVADLGGVDLTSIGCRPHLKEFASCRRT